MSTETQGLVATTGTTLAPANLVARLSALQTRAIEAGEIWRPKPGDVLAGQIVGHEKGTGPFGEGWLMRVRNGEGRLILVWLTKWLIDTLKARNAEVSDLVALQFLGKQESKRGLKYNAYTVETEKG